MLFDARSLEPNSVLHARVCIVGSGMAGSAVAHTLAAAGEDVLVVEAGGNEQAAGAATVTADHVGRAFGIPVSRCIELGGTSNQWHGVCAPLDEVDFEPRPWIPESGWPLRRADLMPHYVDAARLLGVENVVSPDLEGHYDRRLAALDVDRTALAHKMFLRREPPTRWKTWLRQAARAERLRVLLHAPALELVVHEDGTHVDELIVGTGDGTVTVRADRFVVCAGALETPRLLLNSRRGCPDGLGNDHGLVGRYLLDHPVGHFSKLGFETPIRARIYSGLPVDRDVSVIAGLTAQRDEQQRRSLPNHSVNVRPSVVRARIDDDLRMSFLAARRVRDLSIRQWCAIVRHPDLVQRILMTRFGLPPLFRYGDLVFMTEQIPNRDSRVALSGRRDRHGYAVASVDWRLRDEDFSAFAAFADLVLTRGLRRPHCSVARNDSIDVWRRTATSAAHHLGTARMADGPQRGVVDANLRVFGMRNVFVCDGSVFPTAGNANPSLTITALGLRLGAHLLSPAA